MPRPLLLLLALLAAVAPVATRQDDATARALRFVDALAALRGVAADPAPLEAELRAAAAAMNAADGRADALRIAEHYLGLSGEERAAGLALEERYERARSRWVDWEDAEAREPWPALVSRLAPELERLAEDARRAADASPGARTDALLARLELRDVEELPPSSEVERERRLARAEELARRSARRFESAGFVTPKLEPQWLIGRLARRRGAHAEAERAFARCAADAEGVGQPEWRERALLGLLALARDAGDPIAARRLIAELATFRDARTSWPLASEHAASLLHADRADEALRFLDEHAPAPADEHARNAWHALRSTAQLRLGRLAAARQDAGAITDTLGEHATLALAAIALASGDARGALDELDAADDDGRSSAWSTSGRTLGEVLRGEAWATLDEPARAAEALRRALEGARRWESARDTAGSVLGEWAGLHAVAELARAELEAERPRAALEAALSWQARDLRGNASVAADAVAGEAAASTLGLVTWVVGADFTLALHVDSAGRITGAPIPLGRRDLERAVRRTRQAVVALDVERARALGRELRRALLPLSLERRLDEIEDPRSESLVIVAHGALERLPFAALPLRERGEATWAQLGSLRLLPGWPRADVAARLSPSPRWILAGDPLDAGQEPLLPGAARELDDLQQLVPVARVVRGAGLSRDALAQALAGPEPLHVATHLVATAIERPDARTAPVGLQCSNGEVLPAGAIAARMPQKPLVVLAACATGDGEVLDGQGALGLARAFLAAGTRGAVVTLWPVSDEVAREFALSLHAELRRGRAPSVACARARRALRAAGHPAAEWAAYRFAGRD